MDGFGRGAVSLLAAMLVNTIVVICHKFYRYRIAGSQTRDFNNDAAVAKRDGRLDEVLAIAALNGRSPAGTVVAAGRLPSLQRRRNQPMQKLSRPPNESFDEAASDKVPN